MGQYFKRFTTMIAGLLIFSLGCYFSIQANIGLSPWDAFSIGMASLTGLTYGTIVALTGIVILILIFFIKEKIGIDTICDILLVGPVVDVLQRFKLIPLLTNFWAGVALFLVGQTIMSIGIYLCMKPGFGCGPRDSLMVGLGRHIPNIGLARGVIEFCALLVGWLLGAKVGLGTLIAMFGISFIIQITFTILHFDATKVRHENLWDTARNIREILGRKKEQTVLKGKCESGEA